jgi:hypothetical protein
LETQNGNDGDVSDDDEQQVFMLLYIAIIFCILQYSNTCPICLIELITELLKSSGVATA